MNKVLYNNTYGGFSFSDKFCEAYFISKNIRVDKNEKHSYSYYTLAGTTEPAKLPHSRHDKDLIALVEYFYSLGLNPSGKYAEIAIASIKGNKYIVEEYDGYESVLEPEDYEFIVIE